MLSVLLVVIGLYTKYYGMLDFTLVVRYKAIQFNTTFIIVGVAGILACCYTILKSYEQFFH